MSTKTDYSNYEINKSSFVVGYRLIILILGVGDLVYANVSSLLGGTLLSPDKYFTYQSNFFIMVWVALALLWRNDPEKLKKIYGPLHAILTVYISVTFLVYGIILAPLSNPTGAEVYLNIIHHYLNPVVFILDFFYTERKNYSWKVVGPMIIYPHLYLVFSFIMGSYITVGDYIYPFLDFAKLGVAGYIRWYLILIVLFLMLFVVYTGFVKYMEKRTLQETSPKYQPA